MKFYTPEDCKRKAEQEWEMAGCARHDQDRADEQRRLKLAQEWMQRAREGGCEEKDAPK